MRCDNLLFYLPRRRLASLRQGLHHFASTLHRYLLVAVVAAEFQRLEEKAWKSLGLMGFDENMFGLYN